MNTQYITKCKNRECNKKNECIRYTKATGVVIEFQNICLEKNNYKWFWKEKTSIVKV